MKSKLWENIAAFSLTGLLAGGFWKGLQWC